MRNRLSLFVVAAALVLVSVNNASAQEFAARNTIGVTAGAVNFDLSGIGTTWGMAVRGTRALTSNLAVELSALFARPDLQGGRALLVTPEAHLQYHWRFGHFAPYAGGGVGFAHQSRDGSPSVTNLALSTAGGLRAYDQRCWRISASGNPARLLGHDRRVDGRRVIRYRRLVVFSTCP